MQPIEDRTVRKLKVHEWEFVLGFPQGWTDLSGGSPTDVSEIIEILNVTKAGADLPRGPQGHLQFDYTTLPNVFLGRRGWGPLRAALDTNILLDYCRAGLEIWNSSEPVHPSRWYNRLLALGDLVTVWTWRDIRFSVFEEQLHDARKSLASDRRLQRVRLLDAFYTVSREQENWDLTERGASEADSHRDKTPPYAPFDAVSIRHALDRLIVEAAIRADCHVLLTEDERHILRHRKRLAESGVAAMRPAELVTSLWTAGELTMHRCVSGLVPDNHAYTHLIGVLDDAG
ncbi:MAG: hypothetical protein ACRDFW_01280 [bacterium]